MVSTLAARASGVGGALLGAALAGAAVTATYAIAIERLAFRVRHEVMPILAPGARPLTVLHVSDLHLAPWQQAKQEWVKHLTDLEPDLVISTGDALGHRDAIPALAETFEPFRGVPGVFVHGSNDYFGPVLKNPLRYFAGPSKRSHGSGSSEPVLDTAALEQVYANLGWRDLNNTAQALEVRDSRLAFVGVNDPHLHYDDLDEATRTLGQLREQAAWSDATHSPTVTIGVAHAPYQRILNALVDAEALAIFAGHTHGGQVRIPGGSALVTNCDIPREQASGQSEWVRGGHSAYLNVSQGLGTSIFAPFRFGTPPEAVAVTLTARS